MTLATLVYGFTSLYFKIATALRDFKTSGDLVAVIATAQELQKLHSLLLAADLLANRFALSAPDQDSRRAILHRLLSARALQLHPDLDLSLLVRNRHSMVIIHHLLLLSFLELTVSRVLCERSCAACRSHSSQSDDDLPVAASTLSASPAVARAYSTII